MTESKIRDLIRKNLQISREIAILRVKRAWNGPNVRGCKPVTVYFDKFQARKTISLLVYSRTARVEKDWTRTWRHYA
jgi:hypothetical protein